MAEPGSPGTALMERPRCPLGHGAMVLVPDHPGAWMGAWYTCAPRPDMCRSAVLIPAPDLLAFHESLRQETSDDH